MLLLLAVIPRHGLFTQDIPERIEFPEIIKADCNLPWMDAESQKEFSGLTSDSLQEMGIWAIYCTTAVRRHEDYLLLRTNDGNKLLDISRGILLFPENLRDDMPDLTVDGFPELVVEWRNLIGHSDWPGGNYSNSAGLMILDVKEQCILFNDTLEKSWELWYNDLKYYKDRREPVILDSQSESECLKYEWSIEGNELSIWQTQQCKFADRGKPYPVTDQRKIVYIIQAESCKRKE